MCNKDLSSVLIKGKKDKTKYIKLYYKYQRNCNHHQRLLHFFIYKSNKLLPTHLINMK